MKRASTRPKGRFLVVGGGVLAIAIVGAWMAGAKVDSRPTVRVVNVPPTPASASGVRVFIDPATGQIREPTAEEAKALSDAAGSSVAVATEAVQFDGPNGSVGVRLPEGFETSAVATRGTDGTMTFGHVTGNPVGAPVKVGPVTSSTQTKKEQPNVR